jgi:hypothetical protein
MKMIHPQKNEQREKFKMLNEHVKKWSSSCLIKEIKLKLDTAFDSKTLRD